MRKIYRTLGVIISLVVFLTLPRLNHRVESVAPSSVKDVISSSQFSYYARLNAGNTGGDTFVRIYNAGQPSNSTANLFIGDTLAIGTSATMGSYIVRDIIDATTFQVSVGLSAANVGASSAVIATRSAVHTVSFQPNSSIAQGQWQFLIRSSTGVEAPSDRLPDQGGFDLGGLTAGDVTCPWGATASVGTTTSMTTGSPAVTGYYHVINCALGAGITNPVGAGNTGTIIIGNTNKLINPTRTGITEGNADTFTYFIRHLDSVGSTIPEDTAQGKVAIVEAVRVTATVDPTLTFTINTTGIGTTACGVTLKGGNNGVTATAVPFGSLAIGGWNDLAQHFSVVTNGESYVVTAYTSRPLVHTLDLATTIPHTDCDGGGQTCVTGTSGNRQWQTDNTNSGFGYSLQNIDVGVTVFNYNSSATYAAKPFPNGSVNADVIMSNTSKPVQTEDAMVCYRLVANTLQKAGDYETKVVYTATATF